MKDILQATGVEVGIHFFSVQLANKVSTPTARLYLETSIQSEDASNGLWEKVGDPAGVDLSTVMPDGVPTRTIGSITSDLGRYLRWRIVLEGTGAGTALTLSTIFKITLLGHG